MQNLRKELRKLAAPIWVEVMLMMLVGATDTFMLGHYSDSAVAAVGVVNQLVNLAFLVFQVINIGTLVMCSQYIGAKQNDNVLQTMGTALAVNITMGLVVSALLYVFRDYWLSLMGVKEELLQYALPYMKIVGGFAFLQAISMAIGAGLRSANMPKYPMYVTLFSNVLNIIGNYMLIFGNFGMPALGVSGAAMSTVFARLIAMCILIYLLHSKWIPSFPIKMFRPFPWDKLRNILKVGLPSAGENMSYDAAQVVCTAMIVTMGTVSLATRIYVFNITCFACLSAIALGQAGAISIAHLVGGERRNAAFLIGRYVMIWSVVISIVMAVVFAVFGRQVLGLMTTNEDIILLGCKIFYINIFLEIGRAINIYATNALRAAGDIYFPFLLGVIVMWSCQVGCAYLFGIHFGWGLIGCWIAYALDENIRGIIFVWRWNSQKWMKKRLIKS